MSMMLVVWEYSTRSIALSGKAVDFLTDGEWYLHFSDKETIRE
jgi:hypothetical protein